MSMYNKEILNESAITVDVRSEAIELNYLTMCSLQVDWTSTTAVAEVKIEVSNDGSTYAVLSSPSQSINNDSGIGMLELTNVSYKYVRAFVDYTSGSVTTLKIRAHAKGF